MKLDLYIDKDGQKLRCGYTTGSCAAAAAKAAAFLLSGKTNLSSVKIDTPAGVILDLPVEKCSVLKNEKGEPYALAAVQKDSGDDPDSTDGIYIFAKVSYRNDGEVFIDGGEGIGKITKKGLFGEVGEAAINPIPRKMIKEEVLKVSKQGFNVEIFAPQGAEIGKKTFNKNIGVEGGISIIGTKGIVYPMSEEAIKKTIYLEVDGILQNKGCNELLLVPGNYGQGIADSLKNIININIPTVKMSNYIGDTLSYAYSKGFKNITLLGHIGKFAKLSIGIFNTHNRTADTRMEAFVYYLAMHGADKKTIEIVNSFLTAEEAFNFLIEKKMEHIITAMQKGAEERIKKYLKDESLYIRVFTYSMQKGTVV